MGDHDLQLEKVKKEKDHDGSTHIAEVDKKDAIINKLKEEIDKLKVDLEMVKDELTAKTEEAEDLQADLEIKEAGFNNSIHESDEAHSAEIEILVSKVEEAKSEISEISETLARTRAEHIAKVDELVASKKVEVNLLQDQCSEKDRQILDMEAQVSEINNQLSALSNSAQDE